jgi:4-diphosphocytidyl-2-C-methyl-D-erythritol kinase
LIIAAAMSTELQAPAKINLYLAVLARRKNGYHDIDSVLVPISLFDTITLDNAEEKIRTTVSGDGSMETQRIEYVDQNSNLATRAAVLLKKESGYRGGADIHIKKRIPLSAGLGGGSADAAAVLKGLNALWNTGLSVQELMEIGGRIGCDIPALVHGGAVRMQGLGEQVTPLEIPAKNGGSSWWAVVANPGFEVSTQDVYSRFSSSLTSTEIPTNTMASALREGNLDLAAERLFNSLQAVVFKKYPLVEIMAANLEQAGALGVLLSGSGGSVFALARHEEHAREINSRLEKAMRPSVWSRIVRTLPDGVMVAHGPLEA